jgi:uncharacterized protein
MRPPMPSLTLSRRWKIALSVVGILIFLLIVASSLTGVYVNWLWFGEVGYRKVYSHILWTRIILFFVFGLFMALIIGGNIVAAYLLRPPFRPMSQEQQNLERYRVMLEPRKFLVLAAVMIISLFAAGMSAQGRWQTWLLFLHGGKFGVRDPQFHRDISFFAWDYPLYRLLLGFGFTAILFALVLSIAVHYLSGAIRLQTPGPKITLAARRHLTVLVFVFMVLKAIAYWLDRYGLVFSNRSKFTGASYTDIHASLQAKTILFWLAVIIALGVLASMWLRSAMLPGIGFGVLLVLSILISGIYPALVQQISVKPNASDKEAAYIKRNIVATRQGYDIVSAKDGGQVNYVDYPATNTPSEKDLNADTATVSNIRLLDPNLISPTFTQQQQIKNQYGFAAKLDIDRYADTKGVTRDYVVGVRELDKSNLSGNQTNWINQHTVYTHGYGFVAAQANESLNPQYDFAEGDIPPNGFLDLTQPQVYYGELGVDYSVVGAKGSREYDGSDQTTSYKGKGGVSLGSFVHRVAFAMKYKQTNFLLNDAVSTKGAKIIFNRDPRERVLKVAPFLKADGDPYPVVVDGRMVWIVDAYTTMSNYPYSQQQSLSDLTESTLSQENKTASQPNSKINYIRNSVKATVDAYDGTVKLYQWDSQDPVLKAWMKVFPGLVKPKSDMPAGISAHVRYPEDLFQVQRAMLEQYHVDDPVTFYNVRDKWTVPTDPTANGGNQPPYYLLADKPAGNGTTPQFQLTTPMKVNNREYLASYISVNSNPGPDYGKMTVLKLPSQANVQGPAQVFNKFSQEPAITRDLSLFNQGGSTVLHGNLLTLPVGNSFLYVEPLYVQRSSGASAFPALDAILVSYGDQLGYGSSVADAISHLAPAGQVPPLRTAVGGGTPPVSGSSPTSTPTTTSTPTATASPPTQSQQALLASLDSAFTELQAANKTGDFTTIAAAQGKVFKLLQQYLEAYGPLPSGSSSPTASPSK